MEGLSPLHLIIVLVIAVLVLGPGKLPEVGAALGKTIREFRKATTEVQDAVRLDPPPALPASAPAASPGATRPVTPPTTAEPWAAGQRVLTPPGFRQPGSPGEPPVRSLVIRRALAFFLPVAVLATLCCGFVYTAVQQDLRMGANDPQLQLAEDAAQALDAGAPALTLVGSSKVDVAVSLAPFIVIFDPAGHVLATDGQLDGRDPVPPLGVLDAARQDPPNAVTWEPRAGVRIASVTVPWHGGTVLAGRSLREVERQEDNIFLVAAAGWVVMLGALAVTAVIAAWLWPR